MPGAKELFRIHAAFERISSRRISLAQCKAHSSYINRIVLTFKLPRHNTCSFIFAEFNIQGLFSQRQSKNGI